MREHTPGPWTADPYGSGLLESHPPYDEEDDSGLLAEFAAGCTEADARLIAAAPDLLAVCERVVAGYSDDTFDMDPAIVDAVRAVVAKARGVPATT